MATQAYVFVCVTSGRVQAAARAVARVRGVKTVHTCWGRPDMIAFVEVPTQNALGQLVLGQIQRVRGVEATDTRTVVEI